MTNNVEISIKGKIMTIEIDLSKTYGTSASGKSTIIASTEGNIALPGKFEHIKLGLNVYTKKGSAKAPAKAEPEKAEPAKTSTSKTPAKGKKTTKKGKAA